MTVLYSAFMYLVALGPLIAFHEFGHYIVARRCGVRVLRFSIGFGHPLLRWQRSPGSTEWVVGAVPFGGYVRMLDEVAEEEGQYTPQELEQAFHRKSVYRRIAIVAAGPLANFLLAILIYWGIGMYGVMESRAQLAAPVSGTMAEHAGVHEGDEVLAVGDHEVHSMVDVRWRLLKVAVDQGRVPMTVRRANGGEATLALDFAGFQESDLDQDVLARAGITQQMPPAVISALVPDGAAARAGLAAGDEFVSVDGVPTPYAGEVVTAITGSKGASLAIEVRRAGRLMDFSMTPLLNSRKGDTSGKKSWQIGVELRGATGVLVRYGPLEAAGNAVAQTWDLTGFSLRLLGKMLRGELSLKNLSGPVTTAQYAGESAQHGAIVFLSFLAFISATIGLMNLLPIPLLDGGHLLYHFVEILRGRPLPERFLQFSQRVGLIVVAGLMGLALYNDFSRLFS